MQGDSNLTTQIKHICQGKTYLSKSKAYRQKNKTSAKKKYFTISYISFVESMSDSVYHHQSMSLCPSSQSVPSSSKCTHLTFPLPFHSISSCLIHCTGYTPLLKILHNQLHMLHVCALKSITVGSLYKYTVFTIPSCEKCCHAVMNNIDQIIHLYFLVCKLT